MSKLYDWSEILSRRKPEVNQPTMEQSYDVIVGEKAPSSRCSATEITHKCISRIDPGAIWLYVALLGYSQGQHNSHLKREGEIITG